MPQQRAPDSDHPTAREGGADKGRQHGLQQQRRGRPAGAAGARLSSGRIASPAAMPANSQTSRVKRRTFRPLICAISRLPPTACTCWPKREWWSRNWNRINTPAGRPAAGQAQHAVVAKGDHQRIADRNASLAGQQICQTGKRHRGREGGQQRRQAGRQHQQAVDRPAQQANRRQQRQQQEIRRVPFGQPRLSSATPSTAVAGRERSMPPETTSSPPTAITQTRPKQRIASGTLWTSIRLIFCQLRK